MASSNTPEKDGDRMLLTLWRVKRQTGDPLALRVRRTWKVAEIFARPFGLACGLV